MAAFDYDALIIGSGFLGPPRRPVRDRGADHLRQRCRHGRHPGRARPGRDRARDSRLRDPRQLRARRAFRSATASWCMEDDRRRVTAGRERRPGAIGSVLRRRADRRPDPRAGGLGGPGYDAHARARRPHHEPCQRRSRSRRGSSGMTAPRPCRGAYGLTNNEVNSHHPLTAREEKACPNCRAPRGAHRLRTSMKARRRRVRRELAGLVRRLHGRGASWDGAADMSNLTQRPIARR
jgi:hypothetical protein